MGRHRGHVGKLATAATASRFLGGKSAYLDKDDSGCGIAGGARPSGHNEEGNMTDNPLRPAIHGHDSHGLGPARTGHAVPGNVARDGKAKNVHSVKIHGGMNKQTTSGFVAGGGNHASAAWTHYPVQPFQCAAIAPRPDGATPEQQTARRSPSRLDQSVSSRRNPLSECARDQNEGSPTPMHELGEAMLAAAFEASGSDDRQAHGRGRDGSKLPGVVNEK